MARWTPVPIVGGAYSDDSKPWSAQDCVNFIVTPAERGGTRSPGKLTCLPGFETFCEISPYPIRGLHDAEGVLLAVSGVNLVRVNPDGSFIDIGVIPGVGRVSMAHNQVTYGHEVVIANGQSGYLYNTYTGDFGQITDDGFPGFTVADFVDGYIAGTEPQGRFWAHSMLRQAGSYNTLDRYDAESAPDKIVSLIVSHREVMVLNQRSCAFFRNTGAATGTFQNSNGTELDVGCASPFAVARLDNTIYWLGHDGIVYRLAGHSPQRVSTGPIEQAIARCDMSKAFAFTFEDRGHKVFYLTLPDGQTWGYDVWANEWHRRQSKDLNRWRIDSLIKWNGKWIGGDFSTGKLYQLDWNVQHEAGEEMERRRISGVLHDNGNRLTVNAVKLEVDTGLPEGSIEFDPPSPPSYAITITGDFDEATIGVPYESTAFVATGGYAPYTWSISALPAGLSMAANSVVTGTPTATGTTTGDVTVTDRYGVTATVERSIKVVFSSGIVLGEKSEGLAIHSGDTETFPLLANISSAGISTGTDIACTPDLIAWTRPSAPIFQLYRKSEFGGYVEVPAPLDVMPTSAGKISISASGEYLALSYGTTLRVYKSNGATYESIYSTTLGHAPQSLKWSPNSEYLAIGQSPADLILRRIGDSISNVSSGENHSRGFAWTKDGRLLACKGVGFLSVYLVDGDTATKLNSGTQSEPGIGTVRWSMDEQYLYVASGSTTTAGVYLRVYQWTGVVFVLQDIPPQPPGGSGDIDLSIDGRVLAVGQQAEGDNCRMYLADGPVLTEIAPTEIISNGEFLAFLQSSDHWQP